MFSYAEVRNISACPLLAVPPHSLLARHPRALLLPEHDLLLDVLVDLVLPLVHIVFYAELFRQRSHGELVRIRHEQRRVHRVAGLLLLQLPAITYNL